MEVEDIWRASNSSYSSFKAEWEWTIAPGIEATDIRYYITMTYEHITERPKET